MQSLKLPRKPLSKKTTQPVPWWAKLIALVALFNFLLVIFNFSYIPFRNFYLQEFPKLVKLYDPIKGIEPHPQTEKYLQTVDLLSQQLQEKPVRSPAVEVILADLRQQSIALIDDNPFLLSSKFTTFAKIQRRMRHHLNTPSAKQAFERFWTADYLAPVGSESEIGFFDEKIRPLIQTNYFRQVDDNGQFLDAFWRIDIFFVLFFTVDFLIRTFLISSRLPGTSWLDAMLRRWYDIFLLLPFWRGLRILPVLVRLHQARVVSFERPIVQMTHEPAAHLADRITKFIMVRLINQAQNSIETGEAAQFLLQPRPYIEINNINEVEAITDRLLHLTINKVLPRVKPDLEVLVHHSLDSAIRQSNLYQTLQQFPGMGSLPTDVIEQLASNLASSAVNVLVQSYSDQKGRQIFDQLTQDFNSALREELQDQETLQELQALLLDLLEEFKLNYIVSSTDSDAEATLAEVEYIRQASLSSRISLAEIPEPATNIQTSSQKTLDQT